MQACRPEEKPGVPVWWLGTELGCEVHGIHNCEVMADQSCRSEEQLPAKRAGGGERGGFLDEERALVDGYRVSQELEDRQANTGRMWSKRRLEVLEKA